MATPTPPGVRALQINNEQMDKHGLKTGPGRKDTLAYKLFSRVEMFEEVVKLGTYSAWGGFRKELEAYPGAEVLVVADVDEVYGENWWIALTEEAKDKYIYVRARLPGQPAFQRPLTPPPAPLSHSLPRAGPGRCAARG